MELATGAYRAEYSYFVWPRALRELHVIRRWVLLGVLLPNLAMAEPAFPPEHCLSIVWAPSNREVCSSAYLIYRDEKATHDPRHDDRKLCTAGPNGETVIEYIQRAGEYVSLMTQQTPLPSVAAEAGRIQVDMMIPADYEFWTSGRYPIGLVIAPENKQEIGCFAGGCPVEKQEGSSVRVQYYSKFKGRGNTPEPLIYSYHLNRGAPTVENFDAPWVGVDNKTAQFGTNTPLGAPQPKGVWVTLVLDVVLNTFDAEGRPISDGSARLSMYDAQNGKLLGQTRLSNAVYRKKRTWKIVGPFLNDKTTQHRAPRRTQSMYYSNYKLYLPDQVCPIGGDFRR
jgi:hypothetical protein